jgi:hypothetical protein
MILKDLEPITPDNINDHNLDRRLVAYGENSGGIPGEGYIARAQADPTHLYTVNGLPIGFIFETFDWVYTINEASI